MKPNKQSTQEIRYEFPKPYNDILGMQLKQGELIQHKDAMLIVATANYLRTKVKPAIFQKVDIHLFFMPTSEHYWQIGAKLFQREGYGSPIVISVNNVNITDAMEALIAAINQTDIASFQVNTTLSEKSQEKLNVWHTMNVYRSHKISLKDVLHLEKYT
jgi:hypothetical protein